MALMHSIADNKRRAFVGRLQHLQKRGFPEGINTGRGRAARYEPHHVLLISMVLQLNELGIPPDKSIRLVNDGIGAIAGGVMETMVPTPADLTETIYCHVPPAGLEELSSREISSFGLRFSRSKVLMETFSAVADKPALQFRVSLFSISGHVIWLPLFLRDRDAQHRDDFWSALKAWAEPLAEKNALERLAQMELENGVD